MRKNRFVIGLIILGIGLAVAASNVEAQEKQFVARFAGTCINKDDFSFAGGGSSLTNYCTIAGQGTLGQYTAQLVGEGQLDGQTCALPDGGSGVEVVIEGEVIVLSFAATGEQLFLQSSSSVTNHICLDPVTGVLSGQETFDVIGGTGHFKGAKGTIAKTSQTIILAPASPPGKGFFGSFTGTFDGTIEFAE